MGRWEDIAFPFGSTLESFITPKEDIDVIISSIEMILMTQLGERVMRPDFGTDSLSGVHEPNDEVLTALLQTTVADALAKWENRVAFVSCRFFRDNNKLKVAVFVRDLTDSTAAPIPINFEVPNG